MRRRKRTLLAHPGRRILVALYGLAGLGGAARAQQVLMPAPSYPTTPPAVLGERDNGEGNVGGFESFLSTAENPSYWLTWGPVVAHPHLNYGATYSTGINTAPGQANDSFIQSLTPGVTMNLGTHWVLDYEPTLNYYSSSALKDTVNHVFSLTGGGAWEDWTYGLSQTYTLNGDPNAQTGTQTTVQSFVTGVNASYRFNSLISSDTALSQSITSADQFTSSKTWSGTEFINYQFYPTLTGGLGVVYQYNQESQGPDTMSEQLLARINWHASKKLNVSLNAGLEDQQYLGGGVPASLSPVFGASIQYAATPRTSLTLSANKSIQPSLLFSQSSDSTSLSITWAQKIFKHFDFNATLNYSEINYMATVENLTEYVEYPQFPGYIFAQNVSYLVPNRSDTAYGANLNLSWAIRKHMTFSLTYSYNRDASSAAGLGYSTSQEGFQFGYHF